MKTLKKKLNKKGFTLAELLIVVAIIAVLAAIAFPMFTAQLNKAKAGTDLANLRSAISVANFELLSDKDATDATILTAIKKALPDVTGSQLPIKEGATAGFAVSLDAGEVTVTLSGYTLDDLLAEAS